MNGRPAQTVCALISTAMLLSAGCARFEAGQSSTVQAPAAPLQAEAFAPGDVRLLDGPFLAAMERNAEYLLALEPDRLLHNTRKYAGFEPKGALYGGWEARGIAGHTLGHYLTALAQQYAATGDKRFRERIDYIVAELAECQEAYGDGYIGALPPKELETLRALKNGVVEPRGGFNFRGGAWVPWYTQHKILAGLIDAWKLGGSGQARDVALRLADWVDSVTAGLTDEQQQQMLAVEHGGMLEALVELGALTGNPRYLEVSRRFYHRRILDPLLASRDELNGKHANTQIPKVTGVARSYEVTGDPDGRRTAEYFWERVARERSWVIGGNSDREHFFPQGNAAAHLSLATAETCNTYNMLKLTAHLLAWEPQVEYADFYERALYNHILASQDPRRGMFTYFISLKPGHFKTYSTPFDSFWCCVGSGMENHTKYGGAIYFHGGDRLYINLFIPSELNWRERGFRLEQRTQYPRADFTELTVTAATKKPLALLVRCPGWAAAPPRFWLNGKQLEVNAQPGQFAEIKRRWRKGDRLRVEFPLGLRIERLEDDPHKIALLYGPLVLAGDLGPAPQSETAPYARNQFDNQRVPGIEVPVLVLRGVQAETGGEAQLLDAIERLPGEELAFRASGLGHPEEITLRPFLDLPYSRYNVYWDVRTAGE